MNQDLVNQKQQDSKPNGFLQHPSLNWMFGFGLPTWMTFFVLTLNLGTSLNPTPEQMANDPTETCHEPSWLWVEGMDGDNALALGFLLISLAWLATSLFTQACGRTVEPTAPQHTSAANSNKYQAEWKTHQKSLDTAPIASFFHFFSTAAVGVIAGLMLTKGFGPDLGGDSLCDTWNQPEGNERWKFGLVWGGLMTGALCTFVYNGLAFSSLTKRAALPAPAP